MLEVEVKTKNEGDWTWIDVIVNSTEHLWIDAVILRDAEHVGSGCINTSAETAPVSCTEEVGKAVSQSDIVTLQEGSVLNPTV